MSKDVFGYIHAVSPTKKSKNSQPYFHFQVQTGERQLRRAVCFEDKLRATVHSFAQSQTPVKIKNITEKRNRDSPDVNDVIMTKRTKVESASNTEVPYNFEPLPAAQEEELLKSTVKQLHNVQSGQLVSVEGRIELDLAAENHIYRDEQRLRCLERAIITDATGSFPITIWGDLIDQMRNGECYSLTPLRVKTYQGVKRLSTTPTFLEQGNHPRPADDELTDMFDMQNLQGRIEMAEQFRKWSACKRCRKALTDVDHGVVTCVHCKATQRPSTCTLQYSLRLNVQDEATSVWLTAFPETIQTILNKYNEDNDDAPVTLQSSDDVIYLAVLSVALLRVEYHKQTAVINDVYF